jgi:hypothetical protein
VDLQMFHVGLAHAFKTVRLNQLHNALKAGSDIKRKVIERLSDLFVQEIQRSMSFTVLYLFCNIMAAERPLAKKGRAGVFYSLDV